MKALSFSGLFHIYSFSKWSVKNNPYAYTLPLQLYDHKWWIEISRNILLLKSNVIVTKNRMNFLSTLEINQNFTTIESIYSRKMTDHWSEDQAWWSGNWTCISVVLSPISEQPWSQSGWSGVKKSSLAVTGEDLSSFNLQRIILIWVVRCCNGRGYSQRFLAQHLPNESSPSLNSHLFGSVWWRNQRPSLPSCGHLKQ